MGGNAAPDLIAEQPHYTETVWQKGHSIQCHNSTRNKSIQFFRYREQMESMVQTHPYTEHRINDTAYSNKRSPKRHQSGHHKKQAHQTNNSLKITVSA